MQYKRYIVQPTHIPVAILMAMVSVFLTSARASAQTAPETEQDTLHRSRYIAATYASATLLWGYNAWWQNADKSGFHVEHEGWFGENTYRGGADKMGHLYFHYASNRILNDAFRWAGNEREKAAKMSATLVGSMSILIELTDGFTEDFGFSYEDLVMDFAGIGLGYLADNHPALDEKMDFRLLYRRSRDAKKTGEQDISLDYSGQVYLLNLKLNGFSQFKSSPLLRYIELAVGYGTEGYRPERAAERRSRQLHYGISLNLAQLLDDTVFGKSLKRSKTRTFSHGLLEYLQIPGSAALASEAL